MSSTDLLPNNLHHPRPTVARTGTSAPAVSYLTQPSIRYPTTPVQRPPAPVPASPEVRPSLQNHSYASNIGGQGHWNSQPTLERYDSTSPTLTRRSAKSSDATSPTYNDEHVIHHHSVLPNPIKPAVLRGRSASSPEYRKTNGGAYHSDTPAIVPPAPAAPAPVATSVQKPTRQGSGGVHFTPDNLFLSIDSTNLLKIYNLTPSNNGPNILMQTLREQSLVFWAAGVASDNEGRGEWTIRFNGKIWSIKGAPSIAAHRMLASIFAVFASQGYSYLCSIHNTHWRKTPRHLFTSSPPSSPHFFTLSFSLNKHKLTFVDIPTDLNVAVANALKHSTLYDVEEVEDEAMQQVRARPTEAEETDEDEEEKHQIHVYHLTKRVKVSRSKHDPQLFLTRNAEADMLMLTSQLLKIIASFGYRLDASVPLGPVGLLGLNRRELWIFKSMAWKSNEGTQQ